MSAIILELDEANSKLDLDKTILLELRDSAKESRSDQYRELARQVADNLSEDISLLWKSPSRANMIMVNCTWAIAERLLKNQPEDDPERGGQVRVESTEKVRVAA